MTLETKTIATALIAGALLIGIIIGGMWFGDRSLASAPPGAPATVATSTAQSVTIGVAELLFATSSCSSRIVSTQGDAIKLTFSDFTGLVPSASVGHVQAASTTVAYDSGLYGCNAVKVYSYGTQTVHVTETN